MASKRSRQGHIMTLHIYTRHPMSLPRVNFLHVKVSEIQPGQTFTRRAWMPIQTPWVKTILRQPLRAVG